MVSKINRMNKQVNDKQTGDDKPQNKKREHSCLKHFVCLFLFRSITTSYYRNSVGGLLVFDLTNRKSFEHVREWHREVIEHILPHHMVYILIGHKSDLVRERRVTRDEAEQLAAELGVRYVETSAKCNSNVQRAFELLARDIYELMKMGQISARDGWDGVKSGLTAKVLYPAVEEVEREKSCNC